MASSSHEVNRGTAATRGTAASTGAASGKRPEPKLLDRVREAVRVRHYSRRTEEAYVTWIRRFIVFHGKRHPSQMGGDEIGRYLTYLAVERKVSASTQNQALSALLFLYRQVLRVDPWRGRSRAACTQPDARAGGAQRRRSACGPRPV